MFPFPPYNMENSSMGSFLQHQQIQNLKAQEAFTTTKAFNEYEAMRVPTPIVMKNLGITEQDLAKTGVNQISSGGVWITPESTGYPLMVDDMLKTARKKQEEDAQAQAQAHLQLQQLKKKQEEEAAAKAQAQAQSQFQQIQAQSIAQAQLQAQMLMMSQAPQMQQQSIQAAFQNQQKMMNLERLNQQLLMKQKEEEERLKKENNYLFKFQ